MTRPFVFLALAGCTPDAPADPSFQEDVLPILAANCIRCHGYPAIGGAPPELRLDSYADVAIADGTTISGAASYAPLIALRVAADDAPMPPRFPIEAYQVEILERWAEAAARGRPRAGNRIPEVMIEDTRRDAGRLELVTRVRDLDGDVVAGELRARIGARDQIVGPIKSGRVVLVWDISTIPPGAYALRAVVDDGADRHEVAVGELEIGGS